MSSLIYISLIPAAEQSAFEKKLNTGSANLKINPNWLMELMQDESGVNPAAENTSYPMEGGYATGLIQFSPNTAIGLGTTTAQLKQMSATEQLDWVFKYFAPYKGKIKSYFDLYLITFFPAAIPYSNDDNYIFETAHIARSSVAKNNPTMDIDHNGYVTIGEFKQYVRDKVSAQYVAQIFGQWGVPQVVTQKVMAFSKANPVAAVVIFTAIAAITTYLIIKITKK